MNGLNFQTSVSNLPHLDRIQQDSHRLPIVNQEQNAQLARDEALRRMTVPTQPDEVEGKKIDPGQRKQDEARKKRNKKPEATKKPDSAGNRDGHFLDIRI
jgi:hypothetical protein